MAVAREKVLSPLGLALAWAACLAVWALLRLGLSLAFGLPSTGLGLGLLLGLMAVSSWALVEEPVLVPGGGARLRRLFAAGLLLACGEACLYYLVAGKDALAPLGFGVLLLGAGLLWPMQRGPARTLAWAVPVGSILLGACTWAWRGGTPWDLFAGPVGAKPQWLMALFWVGMALTLGVLAWQAAQFKAGARSAAPVDRRWEAALLVLVLGVAALLRFYRAGAIPGGWWYDEVNLARVIQEKVLTGGQAPLYVAEQVENPGAWLWIGGACFKAFGVDLTVLRVVSGLFGLLALLPFWALARLWAGQRWALAATFIFGVMRWVLIPQRIAFMSGFALFWMLAAFWGLWSAQLRARAGSGRAQAWRWFLAGLLLGANLHTYTPARFVPLIAVAFLALQAAIDPAWRRGWRSWAALAAGFFLVAGPMLWYIGAHWAEYVHRSQQVSIFTDVKASGKSLWAELWGTFTKHLLMFHFRGDFNARHNLHFYPHADFLLACGLAAALPWGLGRAWHDARYRFLLLWMGVMLAAAIFTMPVEAPQGHRSILAAPVLPLALALALRELLPGFGMAFKGGWPGSARALGLALLLALAVINAHEFFGRWEGSEATFRSFSPRASAVMRRVALAQPGDLVLTSNLPQEYQFNGFEWGIFARFQARQMGLPWAQLSQDQAVPSSLGGVPTQRVLLIWGESDTAISAAFAAEFPDLPIERAPQPYPGAGEPSFLYLAGLVPYGRLPHGAAHGRRPFLRAD